MSRQSYGELSVDEYQNIIGAAPRRHKLFRLAVIPVLILCTAGGFGGALLWNGANSAELDLDRARAISLGSIPTANVDPMSHGADQASETRRRVATYRVGEIAKQAIETLLQVREEGGEGSAASARATLRHLAPLLRRALAE